MTKKIILGAMESDAPSDIITLSGYLTATKYESLQINRTSNGLATTNYYQVPTGYSLVITEIHFVGDTAGDTAVIGYGDDAVAMGDTAPTNAVGLTPNSLLVAEVAYRRQEIPVCLIVPASKYPYVFGVAGISIQASGFLHRT
jgi:hypothetical protein